MSCDICGGTSCCPSFHSLEEQIRFEPVIEAFDHARELRKQLNADTDKEALEQDDVA